MSIAIVRFTIWVVIFFTPYFAFASTIVGKVVSIADGDTLTLLDETKTQHKIRLAEIDAPERKQPFGQRSKQSLSDLCFQKAAVVKVQTVDRYGRTVGRVDCEGIDANAAQVRAGMAWVYDRYVTDRSMYQLQDKARAAGQGLWRDSKPVPPWEWRRRNR